MHLQQVLGVILVAGVATAGWAQEPTSFTGDWSGSWTNSLGEKGKSTLKLEEQSGGALTGIWDGVKVTGERTDKNTLVLRGKTETRSYQLSGNLNDATMNLKYVATRLNMAGSYDGMVTLTRDLAGFEEFSSREGRFSALVPGKPKLQESGSDDKSVLKQLSLIARHDGVFYVVRCLVYTQEFADKVNGFDPAEFARRQRDLTVKSTPDKVLSQKDITIGKEKRPGYELLVQDPRGFGRVRAFYANGRLYNLLVGGLTREAVTSATADRFLDSFRASD